LLEVIDSFSFFSPPLFFIFTPLSDSLSTGHAKGGAAPVTPASGAHRLLAPAFFLIILGRCNDGVDVFEMSRNSGSLSDAPLVVPGVNFVDTDFADMLLGACG
jgi:hypothetical protein